MTRIAATIAALLAPYAIAAFTLWELNPAAWDEFTRFVAGLFGMCLAGLIWSLHDA